VSHNVPAAVAVDGGTLLAYLHTPDVAPDTLVWTWLADGGTAVTPAPPEAIVDLPASGAPPVLAAIGDHGYVVASTDAGGGDLSLWLRRLPGGTAADAVEVSPGVTADTYPAIATDGVAGGAVAWNRGTANRELWLAPFTDDGGAITVGAAQQLPTEDGVGPYKPALVFLAPGFYLVAWHEYDGSQYRLFARILALG